MRLASRALRDVELKWLFSHPLYSQLHAHGSRRAAGLSRCGSRAFSTFSLPLSTADYDLILPELSHAFGASVKKTRRNAGPTAWSSLVLETSAVDKWGYLLSDPGRLAVESDFFREGAAKNWNGRLLVDMFQHHGDLALWTCLLDYQMRINGPKGVLHVWNGLWGRKALHDVHGPLAEMFWRVMLEGALGADDPSILDNIWIYSEWMYDLHGTKWPHLYTTIISHFLRTHQHQRVLQWQLLLSPTFYPGPQEFENIVKEFALDRELYRSDTLPSLYKLNLDKRLYNTLIPHLFNHGASNLARRWRRIFNRHGDVPLEPAPLKPFLRFLKAYHPNDYLTHEEIAALATASDPTKIEFDLSRAFLNRVQGETFGIPVKEYNDRLGAKWFASSWVSLDVAIPAVSTLGMEKIGPLSFQSIALRAENSEEVLNRVSQLREHGISVVDSNYYHLIIYLATQKDDELLKDLLHSDLHPDVFEDMGLQTQLMQSSTDVSNWRTQRLLMVARLAIFKRSTRQIANSVLRLRFQQRDSVSVTQILEDMRACHIPLNFEEAEYMFQSLIEDYNHETRSLTTASATFYLTIFRQLKSMDVPVPLTHWRLIMINMARQGWLEDLGRLCVELVDLFLYSTSLRPGFVPIHVSDLPEPVRSPLKNIENLFGVYIPQDLFSGTSHHPLRDLFNSKLLTEIIENAFVAHSGTGFHATHGVRPRSQRTQATQIASMLALLQAMKQRGTWLRVRKIQFVVTNCLVNIYGLSSPADPLHRLMRSSNFLMLPDMKNLIDRAWGSELLSPLEKLRETVQARSPTASLDTRSFSKDDEGILLN